MSRPLPVALVQAATLPAHSPLSVFSDDVQKVLCDFPQARLVVYPELHLTALAGDAAQRDAMMRDVAESLDGPRMTALRELAGDLKVWLLPGTVYERSGEDGSIYNTAVLLSPDGELAASYRKVFPWRPYERCRPGGSFVIADMPGFGRVGLSICYDSWFPEVARHLAWMGAEVILNPTLTPTADRAQELVLARAQAITNQVYVVGVNAAGPTARGRSLVVDPEGIVRVEAGEAPAVPVRPGRCVSAGSSSRAMSLRILAQCGPDPGIGAPAVLVRAQPPRFQHLGQLVVPTVDGEVGWHSPHPPVGESHRLVFRLALDRALVRGRDAGDAVHWSLIGVVAR